MSDPITLSADQAAELAEHGLFIVDGDLLTWPILDNDGEPMASRTLRYRTSPPAEFVEADKPCQGCGGKGWFRGNPVDYLSGAQMNDGGYAVSSVRVHCKRCHGTGRTVVELVGECRGGTHADESEVCWIDHSLGRFIVEVLPIVRPGESGIEAVDCIAIPRSRNAAVEHRVGERPVDITLPSDAKPGMFAVLVTEVTT